MKAQRTRISAYALILAARRILLCRISAELPRWEGAWTLPGGGIEFGEEPEAAMIREVEEETGLIVRATGLAGIDSIHDTTGPDDFHGIRIIYNVEVVGGALRHEAVGPTDRCEWHELDAPPSALVDLTEAGLRLARQDL